MGKKNPASRVPKTEKLGATNGFSATPGLWQDESSKKHSKKRSIQELHPEYPTIWIVRNFLTPQECLAWIALAEQGTWEYMNQRGTRFMAQRECHRMHRDDVETANYIHQRLLSCRGLQALQVPGWKLDTCNPNIRLYKYERKMAFGKHIDGSNTLANGGVTKMTVLIYLSECGGGATRFVGDYHTTSTPEIAFAPESGAMLVHVHGDECLEHEADAVTSGIKYVLRTDLVYSRV